ncbi:hypothetical protein TI04_11545, partial [Achromatium sp. WMS2]
KFHGVPSQSSALGVSEAGLIDGFAVIKTPLRAATKEHSDVLYNTLVADMANQRGQYAVAVRHYTSAARLSNDPGLAELATMAALAATDDQAVATNLSFWLLLEPDSQSAVQLAALIAAETGNIDVSLTHIKHLIDLCNAAGIDGYQETVQLLERLEDVQLRLQLGQRLLATIPDVPKAMLAVAMVDIGANDFAKAEGLIQKALAKNPDWEEAQLLLVQVTRTLHGAKNAQTTVETFLASRPQSIELRSVYAKLLLGQNDFSAAKQQFEILHKAEPKNGDILFALGVLSLQLQQRTAAIKYLQDLYNSGAHADDAAFYLGQIFEDEHNLEQALAWYARVKSGNQLDAQVRVARIYARQGSMARAREILQQVRGQLNSLGVIQVDLTEAEMLRELKLYSVAMEVLTNAVTRNPNNHDLLSAKLKLSNHIQ